jgi:hypothetical protein
MPFFRQLEVEPLGASHLERFWPLTAEDANGVEAILGWRLPPLYREFATTYGICAPTIEQRLRMRSPDIEDQPVDVFFGSGPNPLAHGLLNWSAHFEGSRLLPFADTTTGILILAEDGSVHFQRSGYNPLFDAADSFEDLLARLYPDPDAD